VRQQLHPACYFRSPGDGRASDKVPAKDLLWSIVLSTIVRQLSFLAIEALVRSKARRNPGVRKFGDDVLGHFTERLDPGPTRAAFVSVLHRAKSNKAFEDCRFVGLALDGTVPSFVFLSNRCPAFTGCARAMSRPRSPKPNAVRPFGYDAQTSPASTQRKSEITSSRTSRKPCPKKGDQTCQNHSPACSSAHRSISSL
jgi:hypothetical protein